MVIPVWLGGVMTVLLWICGLAVVSLFLAAWQEGRAEAPDRWWSYPVEPAVAAVASAPLMRPSPRPTLQTGAVILAVALAIDVSAAPLAQFAPPEPEAVSAAAGFHDFTTGQDAYAAYAPASWSLSVSASDGWFV